MGLLCRMGEVTVIPRLGAPHEARLTLIFVLCMSVSVLGHRGGDPSAPARYSAVVASTSPLDPVERRRLELDRQSVWVRLRLSQMSGVSTVVRELLIRDRTGGSVSGFIRVGSIDLHSKG